jgi:phospholipase/carboxylesterase
MTSLAIDPDAVAWSRKNRDDLPLLLVFHGHGSNERTLFGDADALFPDHVVASLRGPLDVGPDAFSWAPPSVPGHPDPDAVRDCTAAVVSWVETLPFLTGISLVGFSQGGLMVTELLRALPDRFSAAVLFAGFALDRAAQGDDRLAAHQVPLLSSRGSADDVITPEAFAFTDAWLASHTAATFTIYQGLDHSVSPEEWDEAVRFIAQNERDR